VSLLRFVTPPQTAFALSSIRMATNEAEFFAVATEVFFDAPKLLQEYHAELYAVLQRSIVSIQLNGASGAGRVSLAACLTPSLESTLLRTAGAVAFS
jgi:hypothetical protein